MINGSCLCGGIKFQIKPSAPRQINLCHCRMCQKFSGSAFGAFMRVEEKDYKLLKGKNLERIFDSSDFASRVFCQRCGSSTRYIFKAAPNLIFVAAGTLDDDPLISPKQHIFVKNKAEWYDLEKSLPQFPDFQSSVDKS